jgi:Flp pilus assembly protein TadB
MRQIIILILGIIIGLLNSLVICIKYFIIIFIMCSFLMIYLLKSRKKHNNQNLHKFGYKLLGILIGHSY